ncbi:MAG: 50S ribosomal protein L24 [Chlamydiales bacterium]|nr:50S ribosomal protein L24 [Chlamydiales bacterium]
MSKRHLRTGDEVVVIAGNDKGRTGKLLRFTGERVIVEGVNVRKKHMRKTQENQQGQIIDIECPVHISNIKPFVDGKARKLRVGANDKGDRELFYQDGKKRVVYRPVKKQKSK